MNSQTMPSVNATEREVLGAALLGCLPLHDLDRIRPEDWGAPDHRAIHEIIRKVSERTGGEVDLASVVDAAGTFSAKVGDMASSASLVVASYDTHIASIRDTAMRRRLILAAGTIAENATTAESASEAIGAAMSGLLEISDTASSTKGPAMLKDSLARWMDDADAALAGERDPGLLTGWSAFDGHMKGLRRGELIVIAGRPSMGKTAFSQNIAERAVKDGRVALIFDLEMQESDRMSRLISSQAGIPLDRVRSPETMEDSDWDKATAAITEISGASLSLQAGTFSIDAISADARAHKARHGLDLLVVDYIQMVRTRGKETRNIEIGEVSQRLKQLAKELDCVVIALSQLNREVEKRAEPRPMMSDLRDSGSIEQDADRIVFLYRPGVYQGKKNDPETEVIVAKFRNGEPGTVKMHFTGKFCRFGDEDRYASYPEARYAA